MLRHMILFNLIYLVMRWRALMLAAAAALNQCITLRLRMTGAPGATHIHAHCDVAPSARDAENHTFADPLKFAG